MKRLLTLPLVLLISTFLFSQEDPSNGTLVKSIYFGGGSAYIDAVQVDELRAFIDEIPDIRSCEISIQSHTDNIGSVEYNQWLSMHRSRATHRELIKIGVPDEIMTILDFGEESPYFDNSTWEGKLQNRRVDVIIKRIIL